MGNQTVPPEPKKKKKPPTEEVKPSLPPGPIERITIRPQDDLSATKLILLIGKEKRFIVAWGEDVNGRKISVSAVKWKVSDKRIGSIDKDGLFKAEAEGDVKIEATVKNQEGHDITGVFPITVTTVPPITFTGCVRLFDEHKTPIFPVDVTVSLSCYYYETLEDLNQGIPGSGSGNPLWIPFEAQTDAKGRFRLEIPAHVDRSSSFVFREWTLEPIKPPPGYIWAPRVISPCQPDALLSDEAEYSGPIEIDNPNPIPIAPTGFKCFELWLEKMPTSFVIDGKVTHHGKAVKKANVRLFDNWNCERKKVLSDADGDFYMYVDNLPKGNYRLTANLSPPKGKVTTVHTWLYIKKDMPVDLPLKSEKKTINIEMITFAEKIGYTGP